MSTVNATAVFLCNGATRPEEIAQSECTALDYRSSPGAKANVRLGLPDFVLSAYHLPDRCLDLLEMAAYVFAADRLTSRGPRRAVEYHSWSRRLHFVVKVRDHEFWCRPEVGKALQAVLQFATGDLEYTFAFQPDHATPPTSLFDKAGFEIEHEEQLSILLFSGGLDSLAGAVQRLELTTEQVCLVSHLSQGSTTKTQRSLASALQGRYGKRVRPYQFKTNLKEVNRRDETQRSRPFLYGSIAFALAAAFGQDRFFVYENGVTSLNFARREDLINARASRTTHPQTIGRLARLFSIIANKPFTIETPFLWNTKSDVVKSLRDSGQGLLLPSSVSCSQTYKSGIGATHCGECYQCLDRRIGIYGAGAESFDNESLYANDVITLSIPSPEGKTTAVDYLRQAANFTEWNQEQLYYQMLDEFELLIEWVPGCEDEIEMAEKVWSLCSRHGNSVREALQSMRALHESIFSPLAPDSLLKIVSDREFLRAPIARLVTSIVSRLNSAVPITFQKNLPVNENDLNDKIEGLIDTWRDDLHREHPSVPFARAGVVPDFDINSGHLLIEGKYVRKATTRSKITEGMAADLTKYPPDAHILFVVYDPASAIADKEKFIDDFQSKGRCTVCVLP